MLERIKELVGIHTDYPQDKKYIAWLNKRLLKQHHGKLFTLPQYNKFIADVQLLVTDNESKELLANYLESVEDNISSASQLYLMVYLYTNSMEPLRTLHLVFEILRASFINGSFKHYTRNKYFDDYSRIKLLGIKEAAEVVTTEYRKKYCA